MPIPNLSPLSPLLNCDTTMVNEVKKKIIYNIHIYINNIKQFYETTFSKSINNKNKKIHMPPIRRKPEPLNGESIKARKKKRRRVKSK